MDERRRKKASLKRRPTFLRQDDTERTDAELPIDITDAGRQRSVSSDKETKAAEPVVKESKPSTDHVDQPVKRDHSLSTGGKWYIVMCDFVE